MCSLLRLVSDSIHSKSSTILLFCKSSVINDTGKSSGTGPVMSFLLRFKRNRRGGYVPVWLEDRKVGMVPDKLLSLRSSSASFGSAENISLGMGPSRLLSSEKRVDETGKESRNRVRF